MLLWRLQLQRLRDVNIDDVATNSKGRRTNRGCWRGREGRSSDWSATRRRTTCGTRADKEESLPPKDDNNNTAENIIDYKNSELLSLELAS